MRIHLFSAIALLLVACMPHKKAVSAKAAVDAKVAVAETPADPGHALFESKCGSCHVTSMVTAKRQSEDQWAATIDQMISRGAELSDTEYDAVLAYLTKNFGPKK